MASDVVISADIARENAICLGHSLEGEIKILVLHGMLHLAGFDHEGDAGEMASKEIRLRRQLRLEPALLERTEAHGEKFFRRGKSPVGRKIGAARRGTQRRRP